MLWILNQSDGGASLLDIAQRSGLDYTAIHTAADELSNAGLLAPALPAAGNRRKRASAARTAKPKSAKSANSGKSGTGGNKR
jgi:hypothetical protein